MPRLTLRASRAEVIGAAAAIALIVAGAFLDRSVCLWQASFGRPCPGCGMTRALVALACGDWQAAWQLNNRSFVVAPLLLGAAIRRVAVHPHVDEGRS
jgi:hypothetical protein